MTMFFLITMSKMNKMSKMSEMSKMSRMSKMSKRNKMSKVIKIKFISKLILQGTALLRIQTDATTASGKIAQCFTWNQMTGQKRLCPNLWD